MGNFYMNVTGNGWCAITIPTAFFIVFTYYKTEVKRKPLKGVINFKSNRIYLRNVEVGDDVDTGARAQRKHLCLHFRPIEITDGDEQAHYQLRVTRHFVSIERKREKMDFRTVLVWAVDWSVSGSRFRLR